MDIFIQGAGWFGTALIVLAYVLLSRKKISGQSKSYQAMNLVGAITLGASTLSQEAWPAFALNVVWATIAIITLVKIAQKVSTKKPLSENS